MLKFNCFRRPLITHLKADYFDEFNHSIPLGNDYWAHIWENDAYDSFAEIFIQREYAFYLPENRISNLLDLGAHYGYFSLWLQSIRPQDFISSLMIEPSQRCQRSLTKLTAHPKLQKRFKFMQRAIGNCDQAKTKFYERPFMGGSSFESPSDENNTEINTLKSSEVINDQNESFDLIKCDIEGSEWELLINYPELLHNTKHLLMEWHSWHSGGGGYPQIKCHLSQIGYEIIKSSPTQEAIGRNGQVGIFLAKNLGFRD